jgi:hypothetical protein
LNPQCSKISVLKECKHIQYLGLFMDNLCKNW